MRSQSDLLLIAAVRRALGARALKYESIMVAAKNGLVTLSGVVADSAERKEVLRITYQVPGVADVLDQLHEGGDAFHAEGGYLDDMFITTKVKGTLLAEAGLASFPISVETSRGSVTLRGEVDSHGTAALAERVARQVNGVRQVDNRLLYRL